MADPATREIGPANKRQTYAQKWFNPAWSLKYDGDMYALSKLEGAPRSAAHYARAYLRLAESVCAWG